MFSQSKKRKLTNNFFFFSMTFFLILCSAEFSQDKFVKVFFPNRTSITAELAVTDEERGRGLMFREEIHSDQGMLFVFEEEGIHPFWMKNMKFSIDILWLDKENRIVHVERQVHPCKNLPCPFYSSKIPAMYVLELKAGSVDDNQLKLYDRLDFILCP